MKKNILILILGLFLSLFLTVIIQFDYFKFYLIKNINIPLFLLISIFIVYIFSHFFFKIKDIYNFIYKKRYILALFLLIIIVIGKFNGSSLGRWNKLIQPGQDYSKSTIIGEPLAIRSDEFVVNLSYTFSQFSNDFKYRNDNIMSGNVDMFTSTTAPVKDILILAKPFTIGYLILGRDYGLSFYWYGRLIVLFLVSFEFCMIITKKNKLLSALGMFLIAGSSAVAYWYSNYIVDLLIYGQLCIILFDLFLKSNTNIKKILYSILLGLSFSAYAFVFYPAWQIPLGYLFLIFGIYVFINNFKNNKKIGDYKFLVFTLLTIVFFIGRYFYLSLDTVKLLMSTVYPGNRISLGGGAVYHNFTYIISPLFPFLEIENPCEVSSFISLFPLPIILGVIHLMKNKNSLKNKENVLIALLLVLSVIFTIYINIGFPSIISKLTLLSRTTSTRLVIINALVNVYILLLLLNNSEKKEIEFNKKIIYFIISIFITLIGIYLSQQGIKEINSIILSLSNIIFLFVLVFILTFSFICKSEKKYINIFIAAILLTSLINIFCVNPVNIGTDQIYGKDFSREIKEIVKNDKDARWLALGSMFYQNYLIMNGAKSINATNIYPDLKLWSKLDNENEYFDIYNRYAHYHIFLSEDDTSFELTSLDSITLNLSYEDIELLDVDYIVSNREITAPKKYKNNFELLYSKDRIYIYKYNS